MAAKLELVRGEAIDINIDVGEDATVLTFVAGISLLARAPYTENLDTEASGTSVKIKLPSSLTETLPLRDHFVSAWINQGGQWYIVKQIDVSIKPDSRTA